MPRAAAVEGLRIVNDAALAQHKGDIERRVVEFAAAVPGVERRLRHPNAIDWEIAGGLHLTESDQTLTVGGIVWKLGRGWGSCAVRRLNIKGYHRASRLRWNGCAVDAVAGYGVAAGSVVQHGDRGISR